MEKGEKISEEFENLFKKNHTIKGITKDIRLKTDAKPIQQKK